MSPWGLISIGRWQRDREARCKNISCARGLEVGVWLLPTFPHAELRWSHLIVRAARDHYSAACLEEEEIGLMRAELVFAELSNEKFFVKYYYTPFPSCVFPDSLETCFSLLFSGFVRYWSFRWDLEQSHKWVCISTCSWSLCVMLINQVTHIQWLK